MPKVNIDVNSKYNATETFEKLRGLFNEGSEIQKFDPSISCDFDDAAKSCRAKGSKFKADVKVNETGDTSAVSVVVDLPMLLGPFKGQVKSKVEQKLKALLA